MTTTTTTTTRSSGRLAGLTLAAVLTLGACSSSSSSDSTPAPVATGVYGTTTTVAGGDSTVATGATLPVTDTDTAGSEATSVPVSSATTVAPTEPATTTVGPTSTTPPDPAQIAFNEIGSTSNPVNVTYRANDDAFYIVSQDGFVVAMRNGAVDDTKLLDISADITSGGERGLLGLAFSTDGSHAYVDYTNKKGDTEITEFGVGPDGMFDAASKRVLLTIDQPFPNHNGGQVRIGPDGFLYIGMGDGGSAGDPNRNALNAGSLLGKLLRIDPTPSADAPYSIPADNPFVGVDGADPAIWSIGLRNPWRYSFDRATNDLWIADVGQGEWEEIDVAYTADGGGKGANFGWSAWEGTHPFNADQPSDGTVPPIHEYEHGPAGCSVSGGVRYRGSAIPSLYGWYVYGDYCSGQVRAFPPLDDGSAGDEVVLADNLAGISEVAQGPDGELYVLQVDAGKILAVQPAG